jgi:hypothetical protein
MVEGFITSTNVTFDKFNPAMVPVQCRIAVSMQAMYIGFAAKKTFLSQIYDDVAETDRLAAGTETCAQPVTLTWQMLSTSNSSA